VQGLDPLAIQHIALEPRKTFDGHTRGHCGIALRMGDRWLLHCGDIYGYYRQVDPVQPYKHPCGKLLETIVTTGFTMPRRHWIHLRQLLRTHGDKIQTFCTHDAHEYKLRMGAR
jgi:hypothetical protein